MKYLKLFENFNELPMFMSNDEMREFLLNKKARDSNGKMDYEDVKNLIFSNSGWVLKKVNPRTLTDLVVGSFKNKSNFPPIVLQTDGVGEYDILDGKHRVAMANDRGDKEIFIYYGT